MILGIDASNVRAGGGLTHLRELLAAAEPETSGFRRVVVWGGRQTQAALPARSWLDVRHVAQLDRNLVARLSWQRLELPRAVARECDALFAPGGLALSRVRPTVVVSQNMLPFEPSERARYGLSAARARFELLARGQTCSFASADGVVFLSDYARRVVSACVSPPIRRSVVIPHGVDARFRRSPQDRDPSGASLEVLYVSTVSPYKHQWNVVEAIGALRREGLPVTLRLIGGNDFRPALDHLRSSIQRLDPEGRFVSYEGLLPFEQLHEAYLRADVFVFASSCENLPNILIEAMAAGLPIASSDRGPMPEVLGDAGTYFDPERPESIAAAVRRLVTEPRLRRELASTAYQRAGRYSWQACARDTMRFVAEVANARSD